MIDPTNDRVEVFQDIAGEWRWRRVDASNGKIVATSGEGYDSSSYCHEAALTYNPGLEVVRL